MWRAAVTLRPGFGADSQTRTDTVTNLGILSAVCLPIPPYRHGDGSKTQSSHIDRSVQNSPSQFSKGVKYGSNNPQGVAAREGLEPSTHRLTADCYYLLS